MLLLLELQPLSLYDLNICIYVYQRYVQVSAKRNATTFNGIRVLSPISVLRLCLSTVKKISTSSVNPSKVVTFFYVGTNMFLMHSRYIFCPASMDVKAALQYQSRSFPSSHNSSQALSRQQQQHQTETWHTANVDSRYPV